MHDHVQSAAATKGRGLLPSDDAGSRPLSFFRSLLCLAMALAMCSFQAHSAAWSAKPLSRLGDLAMISSVECYRSC